MLWRRHLSGAFLTVTVNTTHPCAKDTILFKQGRGEPLNLNIPFSMIVNVIVDKVTFAAFIDQNATRLHRNKTEKGAMRCYYVM